MKYLLLVLFLFAPGLASAQCKDAVSTKDMIAWTTNGKSPTPNSTELNPEQAILLKKAQRAWINYRDTRCDADYKMFDGRTAAPLALTQCRITLTQERTKTLKDTYLNSNP